jgi:hypothetical protein
MLFHSFLPFSIRPYWGTVPLPLPCVTVFMGYLGTSKQKTDVVEHPKVFDHVGLLVSEPPSTAGLPFI